MPNWRHGEVIVKEASGNVVGERTFAKEDNTAVTFSIDLDFPIASGSADVNTYGINANQREVLVDCYTVDTNSDNRPLLIDKLGFAEYRVKIENWNNLMDTMGGSAVLYVSADWS